jgi:hypothetical protein
LPAAPWRISSNNFLPRNVRPFSIKGAQMATVLIRITLRYVAGYLLARGLLSADMVGLFSDPDFTAGLDLLSAAAVGAAAEGWYYLAHKLGWAK